MHDDSLLHCRLDHLVVTAASCADGVAWVRNRSGIDMPAGGSHPLMATHNHLTALGADQFLEVIAIDPDAVDPAHKRWFALDDDNNHVEQNMPPKLSTWVVATDNLDEALKAVRACGIDAGEPVNLTRGDLTWRLALRADGSLVYGGTFPILIEWPEGTNPVVRMQDQGVRLDRLTVTHPEHDTLSNVFDVLGISSLVTVQPGLANLHAAMHVDSRLFELNSLTTLTNDSRHD